MASERPPTREGMDAARKARLEREKGFQQSPPPSEGFLSGIIGKAEASPPEDTGDLVEAKEIREAEVPLLPLAWESGGEGYEISPVEMDWDILQEARSVRSREMEKDLDKSISEFTSIERKELERKAEEDAKKEIARRQQSGRGLVFARNEEAEEELEEIMEKPAWVRPFVALASPGRYREGGVVSDSELKDEGTFSWLFRLAPSTIAAAMVKSGKGWGDQETIEAIREGIDIFQVLPELGEFVVGEDADQDTKTWTGLAMAVPVVLLEPDALFLAGAGVGGVAAKTAKVTRAIKNLEKTQSAVQEMAKLREAGKISDADIAVRMKELGNHEEAVWGIIVQSKLGDSRTYHSITSGLGAEAAKAQKNADSLKAAALAAKTPAEESKLLFQAAEVEAQAIDKAYTAHLAYQDLLEAQLSEALKIFGVPAVDEISDLKKFKDLKKVGEPGKLLKDLEVKKARIDKRIETLEKSSVYARDMKARKEQKALVGDALRGTGRKYSPNTKEGLGSYSKVDRTSGTEVRVRITEVAKSQAGNLQVRGVITRGPADRIGKGISETFSKVDPEIVTRFDKTLDVLRGVNKAELRDQVLRINTLRTGSSFLQKMIDNPAPLGTIEDLFSKSAATKKAIAGLKKKSDAAANRAKKAKETKKSLFNKHAKAEARAVKGAIQAEVAAAKATAPLEALKELDKSLGSFLARSKREYMTPGAILTKPLRELSGLGADADPARVAAFVDRVMKNRVVGAEKTAISVAKFMESLGEEGRKFLASADGKAFLKSDEGEAIRKLRSKGGKDLKEVIIDNENLAPLDLAIDALAEAVEKARVTDPTERWARTLLIARRDLDLTPKGISAQGARIWNIISRSLGPFGLRLGEYGGEVETVVKQAITVGDLGATEVLELQRMSKAGESGFLTRFVDDATPIKLKEGFSKFNLMTGPGTIYEKARMHIINDTRLGAKGAAKREALAEEAKLLEKTLKELGSDPANAKKLEEKLAGLSATEEAIEGWTKTGKPLLALSRMWIPQGMQTSAVRDKTLARLARQYLNEYGTFGEFQDAMKKATIALLGGADVATVTREGYSLSMGVNALLSGVTQGYMADKFSQLVAGKITPEVAADMSRIIGGEAGEVKDLDKAFDVFNQLGMPVTQKTVIEGLGRSGEGIVEASKELVQFGTTREGKEIFIPENLIREVEQRSERYVKRLERFMPFVRRFPGSKIFYEGVTGYTNLWKTSVVTGLGVPNPRYWTNNIFGDFSQMWTEEGITKAGQLSFQNSLSNIPFVGRKWQDALLARSERRALETKGTPKTWLPPILETMFNPNLGRIFQGKSGHFITKGGRAIDFDTLRKWAVEDGISDTFVQEELMNLMRKGTDGWRSYKPVRWAIDNQQDLIDHATLVQQRQRMGLYADLLQQGVPRAEAKRRTLNALYDWKFALSETETQVFARLMPFYRFWKLALKQSAGSILEPFTESSVQVMKKGLIGQNKFARVRQQAMIAQGMPDFYYDLNVNEEMAQREIYDNMAKERRPHYLDTRPTPGVAPMEQYAREFWFQKTGRNYSHYAYVLPPATALDSMDMLISMIGGLYWATSRAAITTGVMDKRDDPFVGDAEAQLFEPVLSSFYTPLEGLFRSFALQNGMDLEYQSRAGQVRLTRDDSEFLKRIPMIQGLVSRDPDTGMDEINRWQYALFKMLPTIGTQLPNLTSAVTLNPEWQKGMAAGTGYLLRKITRLPIGAPGLEYPFDPGKDIQRSIKEVERQFKDRPTREELDIPEIPTLRRRKE